MPHDRDGNVLEVGDFVNVPCVVTNIYPTLDFCNLEFETQEEMPGTDRKNRFTLNTKQVIKVHK